MPIKAGVLRVDGREIEISRPEKVLFPEDGITKGDLIEYYARIAPQILPHLCDRPLTLERYPNGINTKRFSPEGGVFLLSGMAQAGDGAKGGWHRSPTSWVMTPPTWCISSIRPA